MAHPCFVFKHSGFAHSFGQHYILYAHMAVFVVFCVYPPISLSALSHTFPLVCT